MSEPQNTKNTGRNPDGTFQPGVSGNPGGRPKGGLKDYDRQKFLAMSDEEKEAFLNKIAPELRYRMAEGNPAQENTGKDGTPLIPDNTDLAEKVKDLNERFNEFLKHS